MGKGRPCWVRGGGCLQAWPIPGPAGAQEGLPPGDSSVKSPFSTEGPLPEGAFRAQLGGSRPAPQDTFRPGRDPPHHLPSTGGQDRNQTGPGHDLPGAVIAPSG